MNSRRFGASQSLHILKPFILATVVLAGCTQQQKPSAKPTESPVAQSSPRPQSTPAPTPTAVAATPQASPARALGRKIANAFKGNAAVAQEWSEF